MRNLIFISILLLNINEGFSQQNLWHLVWSDKFEQDGLPDPEKWDNNVGSTANNEKQYYTRARLENARIEVGKLV